MRTTLLTKGSKFSPQEYAPLALHCTSLNPKLQVLLLINPFPALLENVMMAWAKGSPLAPRTLRNSLPEFTLFMHSREEPSPQNEHFWCAGETVLGRPLKERHQLFGREGKGLAVSAESCLNCCQQLHKSFFSLSRKLRLVSLTEAVELTVTFALLYCDIRTSAFSWLCCSSLTRLQLIV